MASNFSVENGATEAMIDQVVEESKTNIEQSQEEIEDPEPMVGLFIEILLEIGFIEEMRTN